MSAPAPHGLATARRISETGIPITANSIESALLLQLHPRYQGCPLKELVELGFRSRVAGSAAPPGFFKRAPVRNGRTEIRDGVTVAIYERGYASGYG